MYRHDVKPSSFVIIILPFRLPARPSDCEVHVCLLARCPDFHIRPMCPILEMYFEITERLAWT